VDIYISLKIAGIRSVRFNTEMATWQGVDTFVTFPSYIFFAVE